jgi:periplasmic protein TonB
MDVEVRPDPGSPDLEEAMPRNQSRRRFAVTAPLAVLATAAMLLGAGLIRPPAPHHHPSNAIEARLIEVVPPQPAGLQGGPAAVPVKPKLAEKPHRKRVATHHPKVEAPPLISPSETSEVGTGPSVPTTSGPPSAKEETVGVPGGTGVGSGAGVGNDASGARAIYAPTPTIPDDMRENVFRAVAIAHFKVSPDGAVAVTLAQPTPNPRLNQILLTTLREWRFFPAMKDGIAIASEFDVRIPITVQ